MASKRTPELITQNNARGQWNSMSRNVRMGILDKLARKINPKDRGEAGYFYGNLYPKTRQAIRRYLSGR